MLKVYNVESYYRVDDKGWKRCGSNGHAIRDNCLEEAKILRDKVSWDDIYSLERDGKHLDGVYIGETAFRHRTYIEVSLEWPDDNVRYYKGDFKEFSYMDVYTEWDTCSLEWIMKHASAEQTIQYMKERGMTVCPLQ